MVTAGSAPPRFAVTNRARVKVPVEAVAHDLGRPAMPVPEVPHQLLKCPTRAGRNLDGEIRVANEVAEQPGLG
jgi:hypothetical protein